jgi:purine-nucleoside phosphorylase
MMKNPIALEAFEFLQDRLPPSLKSPETGIICGSGLGGLADLVRSQSRWEVSYSQIPDFPQSNGRSERDWVAASRFDPAQ